MNIKLLSVVLMFFLLAAAGLTAAEEIDVSPTDIEELAAAPAADSAVPDAGGVPFAAADTGVIGPGITQTFADANKYTSAAPLAVNTEKIHEHTIDPEKLAELRRQASSEPSNDAQQDTARDALQIRAPNLLKNFEGITQTAWRPPDPHIAAGPNHVVQVVNDRFAVYAKNGTFLNGTDFGSWYASICPGCRNFDPRIVYDKQEGKWLMLLATYDSTAKTAHYLLSVSKTNNPTGAWWLYKINDTFFINGEYTMADYPDIGYDGILSANNGNIYITSNHFGLTTWNFQTAMVSVVRKSILYTGGSGSSSRWYNFLNADGSLSTTLRAAITYGNPSVEYFTNTNWAGGTFVTVWKYTPSTTAWASYNVSVKNYNFPNPARQPCVSTLHTIDNRMYNLVYKSGNLYSAFNDRSGSDDYIHYVRIATGTMTATRDIRYGAAGYDYWFPAVAVDNKNNATIVFARSSSTTNAEIRYTGINAGAAALEPSATLKAGTACYTGGRWGDYFGASMDPSSQKYIWITGEWPKGASTWSTWIGKTEHT